MARRQRPRKRNKRSRARRIVIKKKLQEKNLVLQVQPHSDLENAQDSSEKIFDKLLEDHRRNNTVLFNHKEENATLSSGPGSDSEPENNENPNDPDYLPDLIIEKSEVETIINVSGRRVVDINHMLQQMEYVAGHPKICTMGKFKFQREIVNGMFSTFVYYCDNCEKEYCVTSEPLSKKEDCNDALVWGALSVGIGHSQAEELFAVMDVPIMGQNKFRSHERKIGKCWEEHLLHKMEQHAEEEKRLALEKGHVWRGLPFITVIGDGGWAKRSYGHGMNSLSGVGVIIGAETKKLLYLGVKNKFCYACAISKKKGVEAKEHQCFKNYNGPSTGMESNVIIEGFKSSEDDYGLIYKNYIGDGDSSVFARIQEGCKYGRYVSKIECANHMTRALNDNLHKLSENTKFPLQSRQLLLQPAQGETISRLERLVKGVRTAIKEAGDSKNLKDISKLQSDLRNAPDHVFGNHNKCTDFCKRKTNNEENVMKCLDSDFLLSIRKLIGNLHNKAVSLVSNATTNVAERYMGIVAKFTGGKRVNYSGAGSFKRRCYGAGLSHSSGPSWHLSPWKRGHTRSPGAVFKSKILARERRRFKRSLRFSSKPPKRRQRRGNTYDKEYGPLAVEADIEEDELNKRCDDMLTRLATDVLQGQCQIQVLTVGQNQNPMWKEMRMNRLTASKFGPVCKRLPHTPCHNLVKSILFPRDLKSEGVKFGKEHEDLVIEMYEERTGNKVSKCGLFIDTENTFLGASPDGLVSEDGIIEVKCLYSIKDVTLEEAVSLKKKDLCLEKNNGQLGLKRTHNYFFQIQGQLNICRKKWCDFVVFSKHGDLFIERIEKETKFWENVMLPKLVTFYKDCMLPEIVDSRVVRGMKVRDPEYIIQAQEKHLAKKTNSK